VADHLLEGTVGEASFAEAHNTIAEVHLVDLLEAPFFVGEFAVLVPRRDGLKRCIEEDLFDLLYGLVGAANDSGGYRLRRRGRAKCR
jgi:hypothetical protein